MSSIPPTSAGIVSELLGYKWDDDYDRRRATEAISAVLMEREDLREFCTTMRRKHAATGDNVLDGRRSWRDFRNFVVHPRFEHEFDIDQVTTEIEARLQSEDQDYTTAPCLDCDAVADWVDGNVLSCPDCGCEWTAHYEERPDVDVVVYENEDGEIDQTVELEPKRAGHES